MLLYSFTAFQREIYVDNLFSITGQQDAQVTKYTKSKVTNFYVIAIWHKNVIWGQIPMKNALAMNMS
jgi:hypothetical protein